MSYASAIKRISRERLVRRVKHLHQQMMKKLTEAGIYVEDMLPLARIMARVESEIDNSLKSERTEQPSSGDKELVDELFAEEKRCDEWERYAGELRSSLEGSRRRCARLDQDNKELKSHIKNTLRPAIRKKIEKEVVKRYEGQLDEMHGKVDQLRLEIEGYREALGGQLGQEVLVDDLWVNGEPSYEDHPLLRNELSVDVDKALFSLTPREETVLRMRFGIGKSFDSSLDEVGAAFGLSRERVRQIEAKALRKLRHPSRSKILRPHLN